MLSTSPKKGRRDWRWRKKLYRWGAGKHSIITWWFLPKFECLPSLRPCHIACHPQNHKRVWRRYLSVRYLYSYFRVHLQTKFFKFIFRWSSLYKFLLRLLNEDIAQILSAIWKCYATARFHYYSLTLHILTLHYWLRMCHFN